MTKAQQKAKELFDMFLPIVRISDSFDTYKKAKKCAIIVCNEIIKEHTHESEYKQPNAQDRWIEFWLEVKEEVQNNN